MEMLKFPIVTIWLLVSFLTGLHAQEEELCEFDQPELIQEYWPVLPQSPKKAADGILPALDVFVGKDGAPLRFALMTKEYESQQALMAFTAESLRYNPGYACGEPVDSLHRHVVRTYFFPYGNTENMTTPIALFSLPKDVLAPLQKANRYQRRVFNFTFVLNEEGKATKIKGKTEVDERVVKVFIGKLLPKLSFKPAERDGVPVKVKMHFRIDLRAEFYPDHLTDTPVKKPMPVRPSDPSKVDDKIHSVLLDFYGNGAVQNIQFLTLMNREMSLATLNAFRAWKIDTPGLGRSDFGRMKVQFGFTEDSDRAVLVKEELGKFRSVPKIIKTVPPSYPKILRREGVQGTVVLMIWVDKTGKVARVKVTQSDHELFASAAATAVQKWRFKPGTIDGQPVTTRIRIPIPFRIN
jgi:TonB family protein